jgi:hypothetical protein
VPSCIGFLHCAMRDRSRCRDREQTAYLQTALLHRARMRCECGPNLVTRP